MAIHRAYKITLLIFFLVVIVFPASIIVSHFLDTRLKANVAKTKSQIESIMSALNQFYADHGQYLAPGIDSTMNSAAVVIHEGKSKRILNLTSPVSYITYIPNDPFAGFFGGFYKYQSDGKAWYILSSRGPGGDFENYGLERLSEIYSESAREALSVFTGKRILNPNVFLKTSIKMLEEDALSINTFRYDTSNGLNSGGDIFRIGP